MPNLQKPEPPRLPSGDDGAAPSETEHPLLRPLSDDDDDLREGETILTFITPPDHDDTPGPEVRSSE